MDVSKKATWELRAIVKALSFLGALNTPQEERDLRNAKKELKERMNELKGI
jgi:hypothetical protein